MFCTKCGAKLSDQAKFCTSCGEPLNDHTQDKNSADQDNNQKDKTGGSSANKAPVKQSKKKHPILTALIVVVIVFIIIAACGDTTDAVGDDSTENTLQSEEIIVSDTPTASAPETEPTPAETEEITSGSKYPKSYNEKGELIVYWLDSGSVWHESINCGTVSKADPSKLHSGTPNEAYSSGKERACKTCSADSTVEIVETTRISETTRTPDTTRAPETTRKPETTKAPETTRVPETTKTPETSRVPETTKTPETTRTPETTKIPETTSVSETTNTPEINDDFTSDLNNNITVYWFDAGNVWHFSLDCWTLKNIPNSVLHQGLPMDAYISGMARACKACIGGEIIDPYETIPTPEITTTPETTNTPDNADNPNDTRIVYWVTEGYVWHYNHKCRTLDKTEANLIYSGSASEAKAIGKERACKVCADGSTIETHETTIEPEITTAPEETVSPSTDEGITIVSWPVTASRNEVVSVTVHGKANTKYQIEVHYKSGPSTSEDLAPQISNSDGEVTWTWKVGARSTAGTFDIIVKDYEGNSVKVEWTVVVD